MKRSLPPVILGEPVIKHTLAALFLSFSIVGLSTPIGRAADGGTNSAAANPLPRTDADGNPLRRAPTGHVSNYDESKVGDYELPDPLRLQSGEPVTNADTWFNHRRPEIIELYERKIYGRVPKSAPRMIFENPDTDRSALEGMAIHRRIIGRIGDDPRGPQVNVSLHLPAGADGQVPLLMHLMFTDPPELRSADSSQRRFRETGPISNILARGYGYASYRYTQFEGDSADSSLTSVRRLALPPGQSQPAHDEWGTISAWAWGASRLLDYFETDPAVDAKRVALIGHSRLGKTALWAGARDTRFALIFSSCSGEMGAALARRDFGETVDDMAANFPWQFAGNFQKYSGRWNEMPVDAHMLIALIAPRPVFITGGTQDQWADPRGQFLAAVAAGPVYRLLGGRDLGVKEGPLLDQPLITGDVGFHYHTGGHTITDADWNAFLEFADRHLKPTPLKQEPK